MRKALMTLAAASLLCAAMVFMPIRADAMMLDGLAGGPAQAGSSSLLQQVYCRSIWSCEWKCGGRNVCCRDRPNGRGPLCSDEDWR
jgi:hypothetical protein